MKNLLLAMVALLVVSQPACTQVPHASVQKGVSASDDELLATLASLAKRGSVAICNPAVIQKELGIRLGEFRVREPIASTAGQSLSQRTYDITAVSGGKAFKAAEYLRARGSYGSVCAIDITFFEERLCDAHLEKAERIMGVPVEYGPWAQHLHIRTYSYNYLSAGGEKSSVSFGSSRDICSNKFSLTTNGEWK